MIPRKSIDSLSLYDLTFGFEGAAPVFENISIDLPTSRAVWVRSPGGARGKSTLLKILAGLLAPQGGHLKINGQNVSDLSFEEFLSYRLNIGYGFDMGGLLNNKTLFENLILPLQYHNVLPPGQAYDRVLQMIEVFGLTRAKDLRPFSVPGSLRKLTCVMRAFVHAPQIVFLDDPLTGLKQDNIDDLLQHIEESFATRGLRQIFFTSENPLMAEKLKAAELLISVDWFTTRAEAA